MTVPARILRAYVNQHSPDSSFASPRKKARRERLTERARAIFAREGRQHITFTTLGRELGVSPGTLKSYFCDIHALFGEILCRHLRDITAELARIPDDAPDRFPRRRAAYIAFTRTMDGLTGAHTLLVRDRSMLPPDVLDPIEKIRADMFNGLADNNVDVAQALLDCPSADGHYIEAVLRRMPPSAPPPPPPAPPQLSNWPPEAAQDPAFAALSEPVVLH
jgi:AcrR family transcriptional regulator